MAVDALLVKVALKAIVELTKFVSGEIKEAKEKDLEALEEILESVRDAIKLERDIKEAQDEIEEEFNLDDWITD